MQKIFADLENQGWSLSEIEPSLWRPLLQDCQQKWQQGLFAEAQIGRGSQTQRVDRVRGDSICWLETDRDPALQAFAEWSLALQQQLNEAFYLGLTHHEFHYARYPEGKGYAKHRDQHRDSNRRKISLVLYLNPEWPEGAGGELCIFSSEDENKLQTKIQPLGGRLVIFRSDQVPHEVLPATQPRWSLTGWFRA